jgi:Malic enzyme, NAD binding domain
LLAIFIVILFLTQAIKPTVLIGTSGVGQTFTQEVVEAMSSFNEVIDHVKDVPLILIDTRYQLKKIEVNALSLKNLETSHSCSLESNLSS